MDKTRRDFVRDIGRLIVVVPTGWMMLNALGGCSSEADECANADKLQSTSTGITVTSSCNGHTHDFTITTAELMTPPSAGVTGDTTAYADDGHVHSVVLTQAELTSIQSGTAVSKMCTSVLGHIHTFNFRKA